MRNMVETIINKGKAGGNENTLSYSLSLPDKRGRSFSVGKGYTRSYTVSQTMINKGKLCRTTDRVTDVHRLYNLKEAANYLHLSYWTVRDYVEAGILPAVKLPCSKRRAKGGAIVRQPGDESARRILIDRRDLDTLIDRCKEQYANKN